MINYIWSFLILIGLVVGSINGKIVSISDSILSSSKEAVELCILMFGVVGLWSGLMNVAVSWESPEDSSPCWIHSFHFYFRIYAVQKPENTSAQT